MTPLKELRKKNLEHFRKRLQREREKIFGGTPPSQRNDDPFLAFGNALAAIGNGLGIWGSWLLRGFRRLWPRK